MIYILLKFPIFGLGKVIDRGGGSDSFKSIH